MKTERVFGDKENGDKGKEDRRRCENCGLKRGLMAYIPFNKGMIVCRVCLKEWERLEEPKTIADYHKAVNKQTVNFNGEHCEKCRAELCGSLVVGSLEINGAGVVTISESGTRNWILCDACSALLCHACAPHHQTGYCEDCIRRNNLTFDAEGRLR